jgi:crotonobetainyl-CoA:carnitine CoA-transferase CaiB-like acyl-CoA transferase
MPATDQADDLLDQDLRVLDLSAGIAGGYCAKLIADAGGLVVRPEPPELLAALNEQAPEAAAQFAHLHSCKQLLPLDLDDEADRPALRERLGRFDAVIDDRRPGVLDAAELGHDALRAANAAGVMTSITPFGLSGPYRNHRATELLEHAFGAHMSATGIAPRPPVRLAAGASEYFAGTLAAGATLVATRAAESSGVGDHLDISIVECLIGSPDRAILQWPYTGVEEPRITAPRPLQNFPCSDGYIAVGMARGLERVAHAMGMPELLEDERFATRPARLAHFDELEAIISAWTVQRSRREAFLHLQRYRVIAAPINGIEDLEDDPQFETRRAFTSIEHAGRSISVPGRPFRRAGSAAGAMRPPREVEADTLWAHLDERRTTARADHSPALPLAGLRVIDFGEAYAGPYCCSLLADAGADVIRIETTARQPANLRGVPNPEPPYAGYRDGDPGERPWNRFYLVNGFERNKRAITLDLRDARGRELFDELVASSDVLVTNFARQALERLDVTYEAMRRLRQDLVMLSISGFGLDGPYRDFAALGSTIDAVTAHQSRRGYPETAPLENQHSYYSDAITALTAFFATMAALRCRDRTGEGAHLDLALTDAILPILGDAIGARSLTGEVPAMTGNRSPSMAPHGCYPAASLPPGEPGRLVEDRWIAIACEDDQEWVRLRQLMLDDGVEVGEEFDTLEQRKAREDVLDDLIAGWSLRSNPHELARRLQATGVAAVAVMTDAELYEDRHLAERGFFEEVTHPDAGTYRQPGPLWKSTTHPMSVRRPAFCLGEDNVAVLQGMLGVSGEEFAELEDRGVIGERYTAEMRPAHR